MLASSALLGCLIAFGLAWNASAGSQKSLSEEQVRDLARENSTKTSSQLRLVNKAIGVKEPKDLNDQGRRIWQSLTRTLRKLKDTLSELRATYGAMMSAPSDKLPSLVIKVDDLCDELIMFNGSLTLDEDAISEMEIADGAVTSEKLVSDLEISGTFTAKKIVAEDICLEENLRIED